MPTEEQKLREALWRIVHLEAGGPHLSAKDGMGAALTTLDRARDIARAALKENTADKAAS